MLANPAGISVAKSETGHSPRTIQNPTHESSAPRRRLAGEATEQLPDSSIGSFAH